MTVTPRINLCQIIVLYVSLLIYLSLHLSVLLQNCVTIKKLIMMTSQNLYLSLHQISYQMLMLITILVLTFFFECYDTGLKNILDLHAPSTTRTGTIKTRMLWYNDTIHTARRNRRQAGRKWRKTRSVDDRELYLAAKRNVCDLTISAEEAYFKDKLSSCNSKDVYRIIGTLLNKNQHLPFYDSACNLSNRFASYF